MWVQILKAKSSISIQVALKHLKSLYKPVPLFIEDCVTALNSETAFFTPFTGAQNANNSDVADVVTNGGAAY